MNNVINKEMLKLKVHTREREQDKCAEKRTISSEKRRVEREWEWEGESPSSKVVIVVSPKFLTGNGPRQKVHTKLSYLLELRRNEQNIVTVLPNATCWAHTHISVFGRTLLATNKRIFYRTLAKNFND